MYLRLPCIYGDLIKTDNVTMQQYNIHRQYVLLFLMFTLITMFTGNVYKFAMFTGKHLCWSLFLIKILAFKSATLLKDDCNTGAFLGICKIFKYSLFYRPTLMTDFPS